MKKTVALLTTMLIAAAAHAGSFVPKVSIDAPGTMKIENQYGSADFDTGTGVTLGVEYLSELSEMFTLGAGISLMGNRDVDSPDPATSPTFGFIPLYVTGVFTPALDLGETVKPYVQLNLGHNLLHYGNADYTGDSDLSGGLYWGIGLGARINENILADLMYSSYAGGAKDDDLNLEADVTYTKFGINIGYEFGGN